VIRSRELLRSPVWADLQMAGKECQAYAYLFWIRGREEGRIISLSLSLGRVRKELSRDEREQTHTGANGVELCFSAASISTARQSAAVMNISINTP
jgi:hypothetical protein